MAIQLLGSDCNKGHGGESTKNNLMTCAFLELTPVIIHTNASKLHGWATPARRKALH